MTARIDDETLIAYVDGELDEAETRRIEAAIARDPEAAVTVRALREGAAALHAAFAAPMREAVPERLRDTVNREFSARRGARPPLRTVWYRGPTAVAMAASIAVLAVGLGAAFVIFERQVETRLARLEAARAADHELIQAAIATALEKHLSGVPVTWQNPASGSRGQVEPIRTFKNAGGQWCREYMLELELKLGGSGHESRRAIACREDGGQWKTRLELTNES
jgi:anti-sigma factor RsiW